ncbi:MAG: hypothetical protein ACOC8F_00505 [Planctomycetota bacterium]
MLASFWDWWRESLWIFPRYTLVLMVLLIAMIWLWLRIRKSQV